MSVNYNPINFKDKFTKFHDTWTPKILGQFDNYYLKAAKMNGEFLWHSHANEDELFIIISGHLTIHFRDGQVNLTAGECFIVPKGTEHKPVAHGEVCCLLIEQAGVLNTGDLECDKTVSNEEWI